TGGSGGLCIACAAVCCGAVLVSRTLENCSFNLSNNVDFFLPSDGAPSCPPLPSRDAAAGGAAGSAGVEKGEASSPENIGGTACGVGAVWGVIPGMVPGTLDVTSVPCHGYCGSDLKTWACAAAR